MGMHRPISSPQRPASPQRSESTALEWLRHDMHSASVLATARKHLQIQHAVATVLPPPLAKRCLVSKLENQRLQLAVPSTAHAAKLRQLAPRILKVLARQGWNLNEIVVRIQADLPQLGSKTPRPPKDTQALGPVALEAFEALHSKLRPGPLANAIANLLVHHKDR